MSETPANKLVVKPLAQNSETLKVPTEMKSRNGSVQIKVDNGDITIDLDSIIVQEIGAYHRCKVRVFFKEGQGISVVPMSV